MYNFETDNFYKLGEELHQNDSIQSILLYGKRKKNTKVSIMIPTYLRNTFLKRTIDSALSQITEIPYEVVVVDNNDGDNQQTLDLIMTYSSEDISYYKNQKNLGMFGNWNRCLQLANSEWILILHDDDTIAADYISTMMEEVQKDADVSCLGCRHVYINEKDECINVVKHGIKAYIINQFRSYATLRIKDFYYDHPIHIMGLLINREKALKVGGFDSTWDPISDYIFILKLVKRYKVKQVHRTLLNYRIAVNASGSVKHILGMVEIDAYMRKFIGINENIMSEKKSLKYRSCYAYFDEQRIINRWIPKLDENVQKEVLNEFAEFNKKLGFNIPSNLDLLIFKLFGKCYRFYINYLRN